MAGHQGIIDALAAWIVGVIGSAGYGGLLFLMAIGAACIPLPSELVMPFAGYLCSTGQMTLGMAATVGALGVNLGSIPAYELGRRGGRRAVERFGRWVLMDVHDLDRAERFFERFGAPAVLIGRILPVIRSFIAFPAGMARMPLVPFHLYTFIASWPFCYALAWAGKALGDRWQTDPRLSEWFHRLDIAIVLLVVVAGGWFVAHRLRKTKRG